VREPVDSTQLIPQPLWQNPRVHLLDDLWLLTIVAILVATGLPWMASGFEVDVTTASWGLLALGGVYIAFSVLASPAHPHGKWHDRALTLLDVAGVILIGFIWQHVGALQNPMFLTVFALPVIGSIFLSRWHPYLIAVVSVLVVGIAALAQAPELRWYASGLLGGDAWLTWLFGRQSAVTQPSFSGFYAPSSYLLVLLEVFSVALFACAAAAEYIGTIFERLNAQSILARNDAERGQALWVSLVERLPLPALLIDPDTMRIVACSDFAVAFLEMDDSPEGRQLFDVAQFSYPDAVHALIVGSGLGGPTTVIRIAEELRLTQLRALQVVHKGRRMSLLTIVDTTENYCLRAALDTSEYAALVVDSRGRILAFNKLAVGLFGNAEVGMDAAPLMSKHSPSGVPLWGTSLTGRRKSHVEIGPRFYQVTSSAVPVPGEEESIFTVAFLPVAKGSNYDPLGTSSTVVTRTLRQLR
jgi:PAS domain-containing protein